MRWQPQTPEATFLRFLRRLATHMEIPARDVCRPMAWHLWRVRRMDAAEAFLWLART